jgi:peptide/nickel transport system permease protein
MATAEAGAPSPAAVSAKIAEDVSQWTLMRWRFSRNRLSLFGLVVLMILYSLAAIAPFLSPYEYNDISTDYIHAPPTSLRLMNGRLSVCPLLQELRDFQWHYEEDCDRAVPLEWMVKGHPYSIFGISFETHLFGVTQVPPPIDPAKAKAKAAASAAGAPKSDDPLSVFRVDAPSIASGGVPADQLPPKVFLFGSDVQGRDMFSRVMEGSRISLTIGLVGVALSVVFGAILGTASGYLGGLIDDLVQRFIEIIQSMPTLPLWAAIAAALPPTMPVPQRYLLITIILSFVSWTGLARQVRGKVMAYATLDYIAAARLAGCSHMRIILSHMLPNASSHIIVVSTLAVPGSILGETALSFLGLGMLPPAVSWGVLLRDAQQIQAIILHPWMLIPAVPIIVTVTCYQFLGDGLRDAADPYSS